MFKPGDKLQLRCGPNHSESVTFLRMSEGMLSHFKNIRPGSVGNTFPGGEPTAIVQKADGNEEAVLIEDLWVSD